MQQQYIRSFYLFGLLLVCTSLPGQFNPCLTIEPDIEISNSRPMLNRETINLYVVVHVLYTNETQNISDEQIHAQIAVLNEDFNGKNDRLKNLPDVFKPFIGNANVHFCLANKDPQGNATNGITRRKTQVESIGLTESFYQFELGGQNAWDTEQYINIWVADFGASNIQGYAQFPNQASKEKDGLVINYKFFGAGFQTKEPHHLGSVCTHELGHYFNLKHTFATSGSCSDDDGFTDTPLQFEATIGCPNFPKPDNCTQGNGIMFMNFMDYTDDACMSLFTKQQVNAILETLGTTRSGLMNNEFCSNTQTPPNNAPIVFPNPFKDEVIIDSNESSWVEIINTSGTIVYHGLNKRIDTSSWPVGMYLVRIHNHMFKMLKTQ